MSKTKELAERLGIVRRRKIESKSLGASDGDGDQKLRYLLVIDFESTCWKDKLGAPPPEIIEFPVVLLSLATGNVVAEFHEYVMPLEHPRLSPFCTQLTGIKQEQVDDGMPISTCLVLFSQWLRKVTEEEKFEVGVEATCLTWSDWDLKVCLDNECKRKQIRKPEVLSTWVDIRAVYRQFYKRKPQGLNGALRELGLSFEGREHSGIEDARNTARLVWRMVQDGCHLQVTGSKGQQPVQSSTGISRPSNSVILRPGGTGISRPPGSGISRPSSTGISRPSTAQLSNQFASVPKRPKLNEPENMDNTSELNRENSPVEKQCALNRNNILKNNNESELNRSKMSPAICDIFKTPIMRRNLGSISMPPIRGKILQNDVRTPDANRLEYRGILLKYPNPLSDKSNPQNSLSNPHKRPSPHGTPPFCRCGRRSRKHVAWRPGPNEGRTFFSCSLRSRTYKTGCAYFAWASASE